MLKLYTGDIAHSAASLGFWSINVHHIFQCRQGFEFNKWCNVSTAFGLVVAAHNVFRFEVSSSCWFLVVMIGHCALQCLGRLSKTVKQWNLRCVAFSSDVICVINSNRQLATRNDAVTYSFKVSYDLLSCNGGTFTFEQCTSLKGAVRYCFSICSFALPWICIFGQHKIVLFSSNHAHILFKSYTFIKILSGLRSGIRTAHITMAGYFVNHLR